MAAVPKILLIPHILGLSPWNNSPCSALVKPDSFHPKDLEWWWLISQSLIK